MLRLPGQIREAVTCLDLDEEDKEHLLEHLEKVEPALAISTRQDRQINQIVAMFAPASNVPDCADIQSLQTCSRTLHRYAPEAVLSQEDLGRISDAATDLMEEIIDSGLDPDIKGLLLSHLRAMLEAVHRARATGQSGIEEATDAMVGALGRRPRMLLRLKEFGRLLLHIKEAVDTVNTVLGMESQIRELAHRALEITN